MKKDNFYKEVIIGETESVFVKPLLCFKNFQEEER